MNNGQKSLSINETFIVEGLEGDVLSACTGFYTNALISCTGNTQILLSNNIIKANSAFSATTFYGDGSNLTGISTQDTFVTGGTYNSNSGIATFTNNTGGTFSVSGFYTGSTDIYITGVTFSNNLLSLYRNDGVILGANINSFTSLTVNGSVSATTFYGDGSNLTGISTQDTFVTGGTYSAGTAVFTNNTGGTFNVTGFYTGATDVFVTGGTYSDGNTIFTNNTGGTFNVSGFYTGATDVFVTGATKLNDVATFVNNTGGTFTLTGLTDTIFTGGTVSGATNFTGGLTANTISATTYQNLPISLVYSDNLISTGLNSGAGISGLLNDSIFLGGYAGAGAENSYNSNFFGQNAGNGATNAFNSNFIGPNAGNSAPSANYSNFIGTNAGFQASGASDSNFIGTQAGYQAINASYSTLIGFQAGYASLSPNSIGSNNIIIGTNITLPSGTTNSLNLGGVLFGSNTYSAITGNPSLSAQTNGRIGINIITPSEALHVSGNTRIEGDLNATTISATTYQNLPPTPYLPLSGGTVTGQVILKNNSTPLIITTDNYSPGTSGNILFYGDITGSTNAKSINSRSNGGSSAGVLILQQDSNGFVGVNTSSVNPIVNYNLHVNGTFGATSVSATTYFNLPPTPYLPLSGGTVSGATLFTNGLTANTISATTYQNLPLGSVATSGSTLYSTNPSTSNFNATNSIFLGSSAGISATGASSSNFFGFNAGFSATSASLSNFLGSSAGNRATNASNSNFIGQQAGSGATNATNSNFLGWGAGRGSINASTSNFLGVTAGENATNANGSNFFGQQSGRSAANANNSNFLGLNSGLIASSANNSNFLGQSAGSFATSANNSNFFGRQAGSGATNASNSTFIGQNVGSTFAGNNLGSNNIIIGTNISLPNSSENSINIGGVLFGTGTYSATTGDPSITGQTNGRIGINVVNPSQALHVSGNTRIEGGLSATTISATTYQNLPLGSVATSGTTLYSTNPSTSNFNTSNSIFLGSSAGSSATGASSSNFFGYQAGQQATNASDSNFFGFQAGYSATSASYSNFFGQNAGNGAYDAFSSNFFGSFAGYDATNAAGSNFIGDSAGQNATNAASSNFFGAYAGQNAGGASYSNFLGYFAGQQATSANNSNFLGTSAGSQAINASYSTLIGYNVGSALLSNSIGSNNIIIGTNITLPSGTTNSLNIGNVLYGVNTYSTIAGNPSITPQANGRIGIGIVTPQETLHVSGNTRIEGGLSATTISATTYLNLPNTTFTGGTVSGATTFTSGVTANTISSTTVTAVNVVNNDFDYMMLTSFRTLYNY